MRIKLCPALFRQKAINRGIWRSKHWLTSPLTRVILSSNVMKPLVLVQKIQNCDTKSFDKKGPGSAGMTDCQEEHIIIPFEKRCFKKLKNSCFKGSFNELHCRRYHAAGGSLWVTGKEGVSKSHFSIDFMAGIQVKSNGDWAKNRQSHLCYSAPLGSTVWVCPIFTVHNSPHAHCFERKEPQEWLSEVSMWLPQMTSAWAHLVL